MSSLVESDRLLVKRIRAGEDDAWRELIARFEGRLLAFVEARMGGRAAGEDVVQETLLGFLISLPNYDPGRSLESYLFSIAAHKLADHLRRARAGRRCLGEAHVQRPVAAAARRAAPAAWSAVTSGATWKNNRSPKRWPSRSAACASAETGPSWLAWNC